MPHPVPAELIAQEPEQVIVVEGETDLGPVEEQGALPQKKADLSALPEEGFDQGEEDMGLALDNLVAGIVDLGRFISHLEMAEEGQSGPIDQDLFL